MIGLGRSPAPIAWGRARPIAALAGAAISLLVALPAPALLPILEEHDAARRRIDEALVRDALARGVSGGPFTLARGTAHVHALVLMVEFADTTWSRAVNTPDAIASRLFADRPQSMRGYFDEVFRGRLAVTGDVVPVTRLPSSIERYANRQGGIGAYPTNSQKLCEDLVHAVDERVDFRDYDADGDGAVDALIIVHAGIAREDGAPASQARQIRSHQWRPVNVPEPDGVRANAYIILSEWSGIGGFAHELLHLYGVPDLYGLTTIGVGLGDWSLMATGAALGDPKYSNPAYPDAWTRVFLGYDTVTPLPFSGAEGTLSVAPVASGGPIHRLWSRGAAGPEYFLLENRRRDVGAYDAALPGEGLLVYHVDERAPSQLDPDRYRVALEQADGEFDLERFTFPAGDAKDPFPGETGATRFDATTVPASDAHDGSGSEVAIWDIAETGDDVTCRVSIADAPGVAARISSWTELDGNGDLRADAGETWRAAVSVENTGRAIGPTLVEIATEAAGVMLEPSTLDVPALASGEARERIGTVTVTLPPVLADPFVVPITLDVQEDGRDEITTALWVAGRTFGLDAPFDADLDGFTHAPNALSPADPWHWATDPTGRTAGGHARCGDVSSVSYPDSVDAVLVSPAFLLGAGSRLTFRHWMSAETAENGDAYDGGRVEISAGTDRWAPVAPDGGYPNAPSLNAFFALADDGVYAGEFGGWRDASIDLSAYDGRTVRIRFRFASDRLTLGGPWDGWRLDNVRVATDDSRVAFHLTPPCVLEDRVRLRWAVIENVDRFAGTIALVRERVDADGEALDGAVELVSESLDGGHIAWVEDVRPAPGERHRFRLIERNVPGQGDVVRAEVLVAIPAFPVAIRVESAGPLPFRPGADVFRVRLAPTSAVVPPLVIRDVTGRDVARVTSRESGDGGREFRWDGRSRAGHLLGAGVYFYTMNDVRGRIVVLR